MAQKLAPAQKIAEIYLPLFASLPVGTGGHTSVGARQKRLKGDRTEETQKSQKGAKKDRGDREKEKKEPKKAERSQLGQPKRHYRCKKEGAFKNKIFTLFDQCSLCKISKISPRH